MPPGVLAGRASIRFGFLSLRQKLDIPQLVSTLFQNVGFLIIQAC